MMFKIRSTGQTLEDGQEYATYHPYGITALNSDGNQANRLHRFESVAERDAWVAEDPEHRQAIADTNPLVTEVASRTGVSWPVPYMEG